MIWLLLALACVSSPPEESPTPTGSSLLVLTTTDYAVGNLAAVDLDSGDTADLLDPVGGDPVVKVLDDEAVVLQRSSSAPHRLLVYEVTDLTAPPRLEIPLPEGTNPHDVVAWEGAFWVVGFDRPDVLRFDREDGALLETLDLSEVSEDGNPDLHQIWVENGELHVLAQEFDRTDWTSEAGRILRITGEDTPTVIEELGPSPVFEPSTGLVLENTYYVQDGLVGYPGEAPLVEDKDVDADLDGLATAGDHALISSVAADGLYRFHCLDVSTGTLSSTGYETPSLVSDLVAVDDEVWVALRVNYATEEDGETGLVRFDPAACTRMVDDPVDFTLDPYSLATWDSSR